METQANKSSSNAVHSLKLHIVFATKYRRKTLTPLFLDYLKGAFGDILEEWRCTLLELEAKRIMCLFCRRFIRPLISPPRSTI